MASIENMKKSKANPTLQECKSEQIQDTGSENKESEPELQFTQEEPLSDLVLVMEGQRLYTSKSLLALASPVFKCMFTAQFKERDQKEVTLPGKDAKTIDEMLRFLHPAMDEDLQHGQDSAFRLLPVADEYQLFKLTDKCEHTLYDILTQCDSLEKEEDFVIKCLQASTRYGLKMPPNGVAQKIAHSAVLVKKIRENQDLPAEIKFKILEERQDILESERSCSVKMKNKTRILHDRLNGLHDRLNEIISKHDNHCRCKKGKNTESYESWTCGCCSRIQCPEYLFDLNGSHWSACIYEIGKTISKDGLVRSFIKTQKDKLDDLFNV